MVAIFLFNMPSEKKIHVLYVDDEISNLQAFNAAFRRHFTIYTAASAKEAGAILDSETIHVLITDQRMPGTTGTQLLENAVKKYPNQIRILLTGYTDMEAIVQAINQGYIFKYLKKPWNESELMSAVKEAYEVYSNLLQLKQKEAELEALKALLEKEMDDNPKKKFGFD